MISEKKLENVINILSEAKATEAKLLHVNKHYIVPYVILANGTSSRHLVSLYEKIAVYIKHELHLSISADLSSSDNWIVLDLNNIIIHIFKKEVRKYYQIDDLLKESAINVKVL